MTTSSPMRRTGAARAAPGSERRSGLAAAAAWRPRFLMDIINELRKVVWPSREDTVHLTIVVVIVALLVGAVLGGIDIGFGWLIDNTLLR
ncbi:MAG: preprotein translocase subunit SecE [Dehalococcoidia bacterium]